MTLPFRLPPTLRGVPGRLGAVSLLVGAAPGGWALWPQAKPPVAPASLALDGKHPDRLAFSGDETDIPIRDSRIFDTIAMFAQPQAQPRPWSEAAVPATALEAGIRPIPMRSRSVAGKLAEARPARAASPAETLRGVKGAEAVAPLSVLGWNVPGSEHLPTRRDAERAIDKLSGTAAALGSGTVSAVSRTASAMGGTVASAGSAIADTFRFD